jgi:hypothetical protein
MTTTDTLPPALRDRYALTRPMKGGPVYVFPQYGSIQIDFSALTERQAERLLARGWPGICRVQAAPPAIEVLQHAIEEHLEQQEATTPDSFETRKLEYSNRYNKKR